MDDTTGGWLNEDGSPATWLEARSLAVRRKAFVFRTAIGAVVALAIWAVQIQAGVLALGTAWVGALALGYGLFYGAGGYAQKERRRYSVWKVFCPPRQRLARSWKWWVSGVLCVAFVWAMQFMGPRTFADYWWYAGAVLPVFIVAAKMSIPKYETTLTPAAVKAKLHFELVKVQGPSLAEPDVAHVPREPTQFELLLVAPQVRYSAAAVLLCVANYTAFIEPEPKVFVWAPVVCLVVAAICAYEVAKWLLLLALVGLASWAVVAGVSALPISAAIIIGALIIASALSR